MKKFCTFFVMSLVLNCWFNIANAQVVNIPDTNLAAVVRKTLRLTPRETLTRQTMQELTLLNARGYRVREVTGQAGQIRNLTGLEHATRLESLNISRNAISDLTPLETLKQLKAVNAHENAISDLTPLETLKQLEELDITNNSVTDITPLETLKQLKVLYIDYNPINNLTLLEKLTQLKALGISGYEIKDIITLEKLTQLETLYISDNAIINISPLAKLSQLRVLDLRNNAIINISPLAGLKNLNRLKLAGNAIVDVSPLAGLTSLRQLDLQDNAIIDISPLTTLKNTSFSVDGNPITVNFPLITDSTVLESGKFIVLSRNSKHSILRKVKLIYPDWQAFIQANPVILNRPRSRGDSANILETLSKRINDTLNSFRSDGQGGTIELIAHPSTKAKFGDLIISEIMWGRHETPSDNQWIELYNPKKHITLDNNRFALLFTGTYLDREVIPSTQPYARWKVIDRVRNAGSPENLAWQLPERSWGTQGSELPVSMSRVIDYATGTVPDGSLANSWMASNVKVNLLSTSYGSPGDRGEVRVYITASQRPPIYWVNTEIGNLQHLTNAQVENVGISLQNATDFTVDTAGGKVYWTEKTSEATGKIHRANLDGSVVEELKSLVSVPLSISVDSDGSKLYWTNSRGKIQRSNLNGKSVKNLIQNLDSPKAIALDTAGGKLYWTQPGSIWRANINGKEAEELVTGLGEIEDITVDGSHIYWTEKVKVGLGAVKRASLDSTTPEELISTEDVVLKDIAIDGVGQKLYWTDSRGRIRRSNLNGSRIQNVVTGLAPPTQLALDVLASEDLSVAETQLAAALTSVKILVPASQRPPIYWVDSESMMLQHLTDAQAKNVGISLQNATDFTVDTAGGKVYWTEKTSEATGKIHRANLNGSVVEELKSLVSVPLSISVDSDGSKLYWTNSRGKIQRSNLNGKSVKNLIQNLDSPKVIALDAAGGKLYWTQPGSIWRANINGKEAEELVTGLREIEDITVDGSHIYWTEKTDTDIEAVKRANLEGTDSEEIILVRNVAFKNIAVDGVGQKLYWTDSRGRIRRSNLNGSRIQNVIIGLGSPTHLVLNVLVPEVPAAPNSITLALSESTAATAPQETDLLANYPNPFNPETWIPYQLATNTDVQILIYDARGTVVRRLELGHQLAGYYTGQSRAAYWDGRNGLGEPVASGIYFYQLQANEVSLLRKMVILK